MIQVKEVRETTRPLTEVFAYVANFSTTAEWDPGVRSARRLDEGPLGVGARFAVEAVFLGRTLPMEYEIVEYDPPHRVELKGTSAQTSARDLIAFEDLNGRTRITWTLDIALAGPGRLLQPFMGPPLRRLGRKALDGLAERLHCSDPL